MVKNEEHPIAITIPNQNIHQNTVKLPVLRGLLWNKIKVVFKTDDTLKEVQII
jgi:hypothetical protein